MFLEIGMVLIIIGWLIQLKHVWTKKNNIKFEFIIIYACGVALLFIDGFINNLLSIAFLNLISFLVTILVIFKLKKRK